MKQLLVALCLFSLAIPFCQTTRAADRNAGPRGDDPLDPPNILFILVDDLGKEWISCYGAEGIQTPNIDRLAKTGMKFNNAWCMPQCTPTRVTLLTGQYPFRHGWTNHWDVPRWGAGAHFDANQNTSYAAVLRDAGYATCAAGKWQIDDFRVEPDAMDQAGFDDWCMWTGAEGGNRVSGERYWDAYINVKGQASKTYSGQFGPDVYCNHLIDFIGRNQQQPNRKPMLLYFPMALTHGPLTTTADNRDDAKTKQLFAGMVRYTDKLVGRLIAAIDNAGIRDNTLIVFTTDNGTGGNRNKRLGRMVRGGKAKMTEQNGTAQPFIVNCPGMVPAGVST
ncbi:MAG: sulfatase-like hydrolase/transferase, partial [Planctomycetota bacterium]